MLAKNKIQEPIRGLKRFFYLSMGYCEECLDKGWKSRMSQISSEPIYIGPIRTILQVREKCPYGHEREFKRPYTYPDVEL